MKRGLVFLSLVFATMILFSCAVSQDEVLNSLGAYRKKECFSHGGLQDYTDYAKYYYDDIDFEGNPYFKPISETDTDILHAHIDDFEKWLECFDRTSEIVAKYDFDRSIIDMQITCIFTTIPAIPDLAITMCIFGIHKCEFCIIFTITFNVF